MNVLMVGGAGHVGTILLPELQREHDIYCYDLQKVDSLGDRSIIGDVVDQEAVRSAVAGKDAILYLAMGSLVGDDGVKDVCQPGLAFDVNLLGTYLFMCEALKSGANRFVYASSLSVYSNTYMVGPEPVDERTPADSWIVYGLTKHLGEHMCEAAAGSHPDATIVALRLMFPTNEVVFTRMSQGAKRKNKKFHGLGPLDTRRLFLAALNCSTPGAHIVQAAGDVNGEKFPSDKAYEVLGWRPRGE